MSVSLQHAQWVLPEPDLNTVEHLMRSADLPELVSRLLVQRGIVAQGVQRFLQPTLRDDFPDPLTMAGMELCAHDVAHAIMDEQNFAIFGDFDVDGATSSAVAHRFLSACGVDAPITIPERLTDGYGPNADLLRSIRDAGADVLLMLDCGSAAHEVLQVGADIGLKIVVLDHHEPGESLPPAWHMINPKRDDDESGLDYLAAVGVTFLFCVAVNTQLRERGHFAADTAPDLRALLDLVALGTVCDMVPLLGANRLFVKHGFARMNALENTGLRALAEVAGVEPPFDTYTAGFVFGPRVNAGSRTGKSSLGAELFTLNDDQPAMEIAWQLEDCNTQRKDLQQAMEAEALVMAEGIKPPVALLVKANWHSGLTGLVAGRIKDHLKMPTCVVSLEGGVGKGSGRSMPGVNLGQVFLEGQAAGLLIKGGGHAMAGGFTVAEDKLPAFEAFMRDHISAQLSGADPSVTTQIDAITTVRGALNVDMVKMLEAQVGPFGMGFDTPLFLLKDVKIAAADVLKDTHIKLLLSDIEGGPRIKAMAFRAVGSAMGEAFIKQSRRRFDILGRLVINRWQGRESAEMHVVDARFAD